MFFVLRNKCDEQLMHRDCKDGHRLVTRDLQKAKLFSMRLEPSLIVREDCKVLDGGLEAEVIGDERIPAVEGEWEIVPVDLRLA